MTSDELIEAGALAIAGACGMSLGEAVHSEAWRFMVRDAEACLAVFEQAQAEPEWEYGSEGVEGTSDPDPRPLIDDKHYWPRDLDGVREPNAEQAAQIVAKWNEGDPGSCLLIRRRKAGPWEKVTDE